MIDKRNDDELFEQDPDQSEFQFTEDDEVPVYAEEKQKKTGSGGAGKFWKKLKSNKIVLVITILIVVYFAYQVVNSVSGFFNTPPNSLSPLPKPVIQVPAQPSVTQQQIQTLSQQTQVEQQSVADRIKSLEDQSIGFQRTLAALQQQAMNSASQIAAIQIQLESVNQSLLALSDELKPKPVPKKPTKSSKVTVPRYYVQAIVPGRAWLQSSDGKTITVSPGDPVSQYGRVTRVDPDNGTVSTTSGTVFRFAISEN